MASPSSPSGELYPAVHPPIRPQSITPAVDWSHRLPDELPDDFATDDDLDPDRLTVCAYWRCGQLFEQRSVNHIYCRKACRSRQHKWERAQERKAARAEAKRRRTG